MSDKSVPDKPDKPRRKLFIKLFKEIIEVVVSDRKFNTSRNCKEGDSIRAKGEYDKEKHFQIYLFALFYCLQALLAETYLCKVHQ